MNPGVDISAVSDRLQQARSAIERLGPADHACTLYDRREEEVAIAVSYLRAGLERGELCVCVVDDGEASILGALGSEGVDAAIREGRLAILEKPLSQGLGPQQMLGWIDLGLVATTVSASTWTRGSATVWG
jgi:hypothetical protein